MEAILRRLLVSETFLDSALLVCHNFLSKFYGYSTMYNTMMCICKFGGMATPLTTTVLLLLCKAVL
jgi:hypothetical protein